MDATGAVTPDARLLNAATDTNADPGDRVDDFEERRLLREYLPTGRILDARDLQLVMNQGEVWAPFVVRRQMLIEYGAQAVGQRMILTPQELTALRDYVQRISKTYTTWIAASAAGDPNPVADFQGLRRG